MSIDREPQKQKTGYAWWQIATAVITVGIALWAIFAGETEIAWVFGIIGALWILPVFSR